MGQPAARVGDNYVCPLPQPTVPPVPHGVGFITVGEPLIMIGGMPAATLGSMCMCTGIYPNSIVKGSLGVLINGKPAARMGDLTAHGVPIVMGFVTVLIGDPIGAAIANAVAALKKKLEELDKWDDAAKAKAKEWMGDDSEATRQLLKQRTEKTIAAIEAMESKNFKPCTPAELQKTPNVYAYVYPNDKSHTVYLGPSFTDAADTGTDSKAETLIHEASHFDDVGDTDDHVYGQDDARNLAKSNPKDAQNNADSFAYYTSS